MEEIQTVAADTSSRTTLAYAKIIFRKYWNPETLFLPYAPNLAAMLAAADAALIIGDPALMALENPQPELAYHDLAIEWKGRTGAAWVSAFWAIRPEALERCGLKPAKVVSDFVDSKNAGLEHTKELVEEWAPRIAVSPETIRTYLTRNIHYVLDEKCLEGIECFYLYGAEAGVFPQIPELRWLGQK
jgi:chorismate dehydratase